MKSVPPRPSAQDLLAVTDAVARQTGLPPATIGSAAEAQHPNTTAGDADDLLVQVNIRVRRDLGDQLADRARAEGTTQKAIICRALADAGFAVHPEDLRAPPLPRRRGSG
jgi:hypothetical protein